MEVGKIIKGLIFEHFNIFERFNMIANSIHLHDKAYASYIILQLFARITIMQSGLEVAKVNV